MLKRDEIHSWLMGRSAVLASEIRKHFPSGTSHLRQLVEEGAVVVEHVEVLRDPFFGAGHPRYSTGIEVGAGRQPQSEP